METVKKLFLNSGYQLFGKAFSVAVTLLITALITRRFGAVGFGAFTLMTTFAAYFYLIIDFGFNAVAVRLFNNDAERNTHYFNNLLALRILFSGVIILLLTLVINLLPFQTDNQEMVRFGIFIGLFTILFQGVSLTGNAVFQKFLSYHRSVLAAAAGSLLTLMLVLFYFRGNYNLLWFVGAGTLGSLLTAAVSLLLVRPFLKGVLPKFETAVIKQLVKPALPLGLSLIFMVIMAKADMFLLSVRPLNPLLGISNEQALGYYGLAYRIFENMLVFPTFFINALYPFLLTHRQSGREKLKQTFWRAFIFLAGAGLVLAVVGYFAAPFAINLIAGGSFLGSILALRWLLLGLPVFFVSALLVWFLVTLGAEKYLLPIYAGGAIFNIIGNYLLLPDFGYLVSAVLTGVTEVGVTLAAAYCCWHCFRRLPSKDFSQRSDLLESGSL
mgnify:FL=1